MDSSPALAPTNPSKELLVIMQSIKPVADIQGANMATAARFVGAFNNGDWDIVREVVADGFVFHHPIGGTVAAGPEGMVAAWAGFKQLSPDSWHPIPILVAEGDHVAVLLPTYGHFTGRSDQAPPPTGARLDYGMVNMVRFEAGKLAEMWFGMDPLVEFQQMGVAPAVLPRPLAHAEPGYPAAAGGVTEPQYGGDPSVDTALSRAAVDRWFAEVLNGHDLSALVGLVTPDVRVHPTAMPGEAGFVGAAGVEQWLVEHWAAFPDLAVVADFSVASGDIVAARWRARGTSQGAFLGIAPTRGNLDYTGLSMYRIQDGRIAEIWETRNTLAILRQLDPRIGGGHRH
jgi:predicted ester cyclase